MTGKQQEKLTSSIVVAAICLLVFLTGIFVYQRILIGGKNRDLQRIENEINVLKEKKEQTEYQIDVWESEWKIEERAYELGLRKANDK